MNGMNFKPFINSLLDSLSDADLKTFATLINTHSNSFKKRSLLEGNIVAGDKGISLATILLDSQTIRSGYLVYNNSYCVLLAFNSNSERVTEFLINPSTNTFELVKEYITTDYLRHELAIRGVAAGEVGNIVAKIETNNITGLTKSQLDSLEPGDVVNKITGSDTHSYRVSYKGSGICLTYTDAGYMETVSYDKSGSNWVYNSKDVTQVPSDTDIHDMIKSDVEGGTLSNAKPLYWHSITLRRVYSSNLVFYFDFIIINNSETPFTLTTFKDWLDEHPTARVKIVQGFEKDHPSNLVSYFNRDSGNGISIKTIDLTNGQEIASVFNYTEESGTTLTDIGVNKIN